MVDSIYYLGDRFTKTQSNSLYALKDVDKEVTVAIVQLNDNVLDQSKIGSILNKSYIEAFLNTKKYKHNDLQVVSLWKTYSNFKMAMVLTPELQRDQVAFADLRSLVFQNGGVFSRLLLPICYHLRKVVEVW